MQYACSLPGRAESERAPNQGSSAWRPLLREGFSHFRLHYSAARARRGRPLPPPPAEPVIRTDTPRGLPMSESTKPGSSDEPAFRCTAAAAGEIEARWQAYWIEHGTFEAPSPSGPLAPRPDGPSGAATRLEIP